MSDGIASRCMFSLKLPWAKNSSRDGSAKSIQDQIVEALKHCRSLKDDDIHVRVEKSVVYLTGSVKCFENRRLAADAAWSIAGVDDVINYLRADF